MCERKTRENVCVKKREGEKCGAKLPFKELLQKKCFFVRVQVNNPMRVAQVARHSEKRDVGGVANTRTS